MPPHVEDNTASASVTESNTEARLQPGPMAVQATTCVRNGAEELMPTYVHVPPLQGRAGGAEVGTQIVSTATLQAMVIKPALQTVHGLHAPAFEEVEKVDPFTQGVH